MGSEMMMLQQLMQSLGGAMAWSYAIYVAGMFAALLWRKESVTNWGLFRASYLLFGASLILPPIVQPVVMMTMYGGAFRGGGPTAGDASVLLGAVSNGIGPILFASAVICGLGSMMPRRVFSMPPPSMPQQQHPLD
jgi:hypothetical protein